MSDLSEVLPHFDQKPWKHLTFSLEKKGISTSELITCDPKWLAKFIPLPLREVERMAKAVTRALHQDLNTKNSLVTPNADPQEENLPKKRKLILKKGFPKPEIQFITSLDPIIDEFLGGGLPAGYVTEVVGESTAGKSQFVHALLLAATLKPPHGLGMAALYITTEDDLMTTRLQQILDTNPTFKDMPKNELPNLDHIFTIRVSNLTEQESVLVHRLRPEIRRRKIGLVVIDSITAHFRAEFGGNNPKVLAARAIELQNIGRSLQQLAHEDKIAVVLTNQVSDRFDDIRSIREQNQASSILDKSDVSFSEPVRTQLMDKASQVRREKVLSLDHQQMFFTGWGDDLGDFHEIMKTPALGLTWTTQLDARIALKVIERFRNDKNNLSHNKSSRIRLMKVVFATWTAPSRGPLRYELLERGITGLPQTSRTAYGDLKFGNRNSMDEDDSKFLDPKYWDDEINFDEEAG